MLYNDKTSREIVIEYRFQILNKAKTVLVLLLRLCVFFFRSRTTFFYQKAS